MILAVVTTCRNLVFFTGYDLLSGLLLSFFLFFLFFFFFLIDFFFMFSLSKISLTVRIFEDRCIYVVLSWYLVFLLILLIFFFLFLFFVRINTELTQYFKGIIREMFCFFNHFMSDEARSKIFIVGP